MNSVKEAAAALTAEMTQTALDAVNEYKEKNPPAKIQQETTSMLDVAKNEIVRKLLGFDHRSWGKRDWKLDHCNGRAGNSIAGDYIRNNQRKAVDDWLKTVDISTTLMTKTMEASLIKEAQNCFKLEFQRKIKEFAKAEADRTFQSMLDNNSFENILQMNELLGEGQ